MRGEKRWEGGEVVKWEGGKVGGGASQDVVELLAEESHRLLSLSISLSAQ